MHLALTDEQGFLLEAATDALGRIDTLAAARAALDGAPRAELWPLARDAGWTGLLTGEEADGAAMGPGDAMLVLERCGARLADAGLVGHLPAVALLEAAGAEVELRRALGAGEQRAAFVDLDLAGPVLDAPGADVLVVAGGGAAPRVAQGGGAVTVVRAYDATRAVGGVDASALGGDPLAVPERALARARALQRALLAAESLGAADACLTMARDYALDRVAFGRQIGSYQAIKHKLVEMLRRNENTRSLVGAAGRSLAEDRPDATLLAAAAQSIATDALDYAATECIFIHGGIGATWEHDASLYYRRAELSRRLLGGADAAALLVADELLTPRRRSEHG